MQYNCGACGKVCTGGKKCVNSQCQCENGLQDCNGQCVDVLTNQNNCGGWPLLSPLPSRDFFLSALPGFYAPAAQGGAARSPCRPLGEGVPASQCRCSSMLRALRVPPPTLARRLLQPRLRLRPVLQRRAVQLLQW